MPIRHLVLQAGVFLFKSTLMLDGGGVPMPLAYAIPALATVKVSAWASANNAEAACHWWGILIDD